MIPIKRTPPPAFLSDKKKRWHKETTKAIDHYSIPGQATAFDFKAYNDPLLKEELKKIFKKCAYCESSYSATSDGDIEHFRPKGEVSDKIPTTTPGYYWLANDWDNLLLSCMHCNQRRKHNLHNEDGLVSAGKLDQFPLTDEKFRVSNHSRSLAKEEAARLLINPCKEDPQKHFTYDDKEAVIVGTTRMATTSIKVYALQRTPLVHERKNVLVLLLTQIDRVMRELDRYNTHPSDQQLGYLKQELQVLLSFTKDEKPYAGMSRFFVKKFLKQNKVLKEL